jgi:hypothetical protein
MVKKDKCSCSMNEKDNLVINSFPVPRGRILKQYAFKHDLLPKNAKTRKALIKYFEGKDQNMYEIEYE